MKRGHYIWNRAERVNKENMPHVVIEAFNKWQMAQTKSLEFKSEKGKANTLSRIKKQKKQMEQNLTYLGYKIN
jgi:hypothetical protein